MLTVLSLVTSVKDYIEIAHKLIESQNGNVFLNTAESFDLVGLTAQENLNFTEAHKSLLNQTIFNNYTEFGAVLTYVVLYFKQFLTSFFSFTWLNQIWSLPLIVPDIASAMISEVSVLDSFFTNAFNSSAVETGLSASNATSLASGAITQTQNLGSAGFIFSKTSEKFITGFINSLFLVLPTSTAHLITLRRFVIQGLEAGYIAGLGTIAGNILWLASIILGWRFIVIPWLSFDVFRYILGFCLLVKYLWDCSKDYSSASNKTNPTKVLENNTKKNIFVLNFLLALTEQTSIYPFISNLSFGPEGSVLESLNKPAAVGTMLQTYSTSGQPFDFVSNLYASIYLLDGCYLLGLLLGCFSLLQFTVWFWENPAFSMYMWMITSYRVTTSSYYKVLNFIFLYLTMLCAISSIPYFGLDYTLTNPLGLIPQDRIIDQKFTTANGPSEKILQETAFLGIQPTDKNTRIRDGIHARRERWKERLIKYQAFDASLYDQGAYDILTIEDLNYGFERFWLRRKLRNHQIRFRLFPGPWMRSLKKQLNKPGFSGPRVEFFRILFEQYYHPIFHATAANQKNGGKLSSLKVAKTQFETANTDVLYSTSDKNKLNLKKGLVGSNLDILERDRSNVSALRKFSRNLNNRLNTASGFEVPENNAKYNSVSINATLQPIYSKSFKNLFSKITEEYSKEKRNIFRNISKNTLNNSEYSLNLVFQKTGHKAYNIRKKLSKKERLLLSNKMFLLNNGLTKTKLENNTQPSLLIAEKAGLVGYGAATTSILGRPFGASLEPLKLYLRKDEALKRKFRYYSTTVIRNLSVGNNSPYFKTMLKRAFYYHKPSLRWKRTMFTAAMRRGFRKKSSRPKKLVYTTNTLTDSKLQNTTEVYPNTSETAIFTKTSSYSVLGKKASRYRYQIYKDVLQHWYYSPFNRLLLKFDIDSFINRQPKSHFLTKKEENLLHLRRVLLSEHYNSLRWYTYMQHYNTMKSNIGSTKSFASTVYNQQFQGTFKKIRHLFAITPIQVKQPEAYKIPSGSESVVFGTEKTQNMPVLKFDQPLYNPLNSSYDFAGTGLVGTAQPEKKFNLLPTYLHEELNSQDIKQPTPPQTKNLDNFYDLSRKITQDNSTLESNSSVVINQSNIMDSKEILLTLLKECKRRLNDQAFFKNYITHRIDKREQRKNEVQNELDKNLQLFQNWLSPIGVNNFISSGSAFNTNQKDKKSIKKAVESSPQGLEDLLMQTTGVRKALNDGIFVLNNINPASSVSSNLTVNKNIKLFKAAPNNQKLGFTAPPEKQNYLLLNSTKEEKIKQTLQSIKALTKTTNNGFNGNKTSKASPETTKKLDNLLKQLSSLRFKTTNLVKQTFNYNKIFAAKTEKSIEWWKQKQRVMTKRKASRKKARFKNIKSSLEQNAKVASGNKNMYNFAGFDSLMSVQQGLRSKRNYDSVDTTLTTQNLRKKQYGIINNIVGLANAENTPEASVEQYGKAGNLASELAAQKNSITKSSSNFLKTLFLKKFNSKRSSKGSRYRYMSNSRGFAYVRRPKNVSIENLSYNSSQSESPTLVSLGLGENLDGTGKQQKVLIFTAMLEKLKKKFKSTNIDNNAQSSQNTNLQAIKNILVKESIKKSPIQKRSKRSWKKRKRHKLTKNHYKYRKRNIHSSGKLRNLNKKLKRIQTTVELQNWWWNVYLPNYIQKANSTRVGLNHKNKGSVQAGNLEKTEGLGYGYGGGLKSLSTSKALDIRAELQKGWPDKNTSIQKKASSADTVGGLDNLLNISTAMPELSKQSGNLLATEKIGYNPFKDILQNYNTTNIPFYAGWDESLRKFVVTNRLLSRRDAGFRTSVYSKGQDADVAGNKTKPDQNKALANQNFTKAPIQGLNEGSFLYLQTEMPFNSYIIDQFIPNNQSFYAPLGWKRFQFRHSLFKNWQNHSKAVPNKNNNLKYGFTGSTADSIFLTNKTLSNLNYSSTKNVAAHVFTAVKAEGLVGLDRFINQKNIFSQEKKNIQILQNKRIKKRYKLLKQTPIQLMYVPTGALLNEILPSHYVSVFDKQYRVPRNIYLKRYLPSATKAVESKNAGNSVGQKTNSGVGIKTAEPYLTILEYSNSLIKYGQSTPNDFTLRKKVKPRRKYHKKRFAKKDGLIFPRRQKFSINTKNLVDNGNIENLQQSGVAQAIDYSSSGFRLRPSTKYGGSKAGSAGKQNTAPQGGKSGAKKVLSKPVRLRQLRNREFKQVFKPLQKFQPRSGGFVWPGDYLRFEIVPMPKLNNTNILKVENTEKTGVGLNTKAVQKTSQEAKRKINVQPVGLLPRKYLLQKHNLKVLKKKLYLSNS